MSELNTELATLGAYAETQEYGKREVYFEAIQSRIEGKEVKLPMFANRRVAKWAKANPETIVGRAALLDAFTQFSEPASAFTELSSYSDKEQLQTYPYYLATGKDSHAFVCPEGPEPDKEYVMRIPNSTRVWQHAPGRRHEYVEDYVSGLCRAKGMPFLEQIVAFSYEQNAVVSERLPGTELLNSKELTDIPEEHVQQFVTTMHMAAENGIYLDYSLGNITYDPNTGFHFLDYMSKNSLLKYGTISDVVEHISECIGPKESRLAWTALGHRLTAYIEA